MKREQTGYFKDQEGDGWWKEKKIQNTFTI